jgi:hypothetical protein
MSVNIGAERKNVTIIPSDTAIALALDSTLSGGIRRSLSLTQTLIDAAAAGDEDAGRWLAKAGIEVGTASNGVTIVIGKDGNIGSWIV